jgi:hypothetical protein
MTITRTLMTLAEALSNTGGILGFIYVAFRILISKLQEFDYQSALLKKIFIYDPTELKEGHNH